MANKLRYLLKKGLRIFWSVVKQIFWESKFLICLVRCLRRRAHSLRPIWRNCSMTTSWRPTTSTLILRMRSSDCFCVLTYFFTLKRFKKWSLLLKSQSSLVILNQTCKNLKKIMRKRHDQTSLFSMTKTLESSFIGNSRNTQTAL